MNLNGNLKKYKWKRKNTFPFILIHRKNACPQKKTSRLKNVG